MIKTFADPHTRELYATGSSKRIPPEIAKRAIRKLENVDLATRLDVLRAPPGDRLHALAGDRKGQHAISIHDEWRICFLLMDGDAYDSIGAKASAHPILGATDNIGSFQAPEEATRTR